MKKERQWFHNTVYALLPLMLFGVDYLNLLAFPIGLHRHESVRELVVFGIIGVSTLLMLAKVFLLWKEAPSNRKPILGVGIILVLFTATHLAAMIIRPDKAYILKRMLLNGCYLVLACCGSLVIYLEQKIQKFLKYCKIYAIVALPVILFYCIRLYVSDIEDAENLGVLPYMQIAYLLLAICTALLAEKYLLPAGPRMWGMKWNFPLYLIYVVAITLSGTKGAIICAIVCSVLVCIYTIWQTNTGKRILLLPIITVLIVGAFTTVLYPHNGSDSRFVAMLKEQLGMNDFAIEYDELQGKLDEIAPVHPTQVTTVEETPSSTHPQVEQADTNLRKPSEIIAYYETGRALAEFQCGKITKEEYDAIEILYRDFVWTSSGLRNYLWRSALSEIKNSPALGLGPYGFYGLYGMDPHNFFLETAVDFGLPILILILCLGVYTFVKLISLSFRQEYVAVFLLYVLTFLFQRMVSGSLYDYMTFFQYGICVILMLAFRKEKAK